MTVEDSPAAMQWNPALWCVIFAGKWVAKCTTAAEAWDAFRRYDDKVLSVIEQLNVSADRRYGARSRVFAGPLGQELRYEFFHGNVRLDLSEFREAVRAEAEMT